MHGYYTKACMVVVLQPCSQAKLLAIKKEIITELRFDFVMSKPKQFSREKIEKIYAQYIKEWVTGGSGEVAIMTDKSEVFLESQEILSSRGWHPLTKKNIQQHQARIENNLSKKDEGFSREELLAELTASGYNIKVVSD